MTEKPSQLELQSILTSTCVGGLALEGCLTLTSSDTLADAACSMRGASHGCAVICSGKKLVGIFTERDLLRAIAAGRSLETPILDAMTANPKTVTTNDTLFDVCRSMDEGGYRRLPVVDPAGAPVGVVDVKGIVHFLVEHFPSAIYNQASHAQLLTRRREGA
jgi:signal-transduction protein with cAMP-binding, CBS, and nucleotidyltransferase domain